MIFCVSDMLLGLVLCVLVGGSSAFVTITKYNIGNRTYYERFEQPWFRTMHYDHDRINADEKDESPFGKHFVPEDDVFIAPDWNKRELLYLQCLNRTCVCGYYKGRVVENECILPNGNALKRAVRKELRALSDIERYHVEKALNKMKSNGIYNRLGRVHKYSGVHSGPAFIIWHREFLKRFELVFREHLDDEFKYLGVPYWDSTLESRLDKPKESLVFSKIFLGEVDEDGYVKNGPYHNWKTMEGRSQIQRKFDEDKDGELLNNPRVEWITNNDDLNMVLGTTMPLTTCPMNHTLDARMLEYSHDYVHFFVNGDMSKSFSSSNDIIFIYHHSMVDWIFEEWRQTMQTRDERENEYPKSDERCFPYWHFIDSQMPMMTPMRNRDALSNGYTDHLYEFESRPSCSRQNPTCHSDYLFCYIPEDEDEPAECVSKIRKNGSCKGFEKYPSCYWGSCVDGVCTGDEPMQKVKKDKLRLKPFAM